ncbi:MAG: ornithine cyclodeaminase family protein [Chloroflexi bacterium]|nr:ornithine cyclodeaminase family protein [Chloroflexota bacterium]
MPSNDELPFLDGDRIRAAVPMADLLDAVEAAYRDVTDGRDRSPLRSHVELSGGALLLMPGVRQGGAGASVKLVTVMPNNAEHGLPTIHALLIWFDAATGRPTALLDGAAVTAMRTGAASGVGTRLLARTDAQTLAVIGAGGQAEWQIRAVLAARSIRRVRVFARDAARRDAFAARMSASTGMEVTGAASAEAALAGADVVCCATTSAEPVFEAAWVKPGAHVNGIGAYHLGMVELPPELFARAAVVAVDSHAAADRSRSATWRARARRAAASRSSAVPRGAGRVASRSGSGAEWHPPTARIGPRHGRASPSCRPPGRAPAPTPAFRWRSPGSPLPPVRHRP